MARKKTGAIWNDQKFQWVGFGLVALFLFTKAEVIDLGGEIKVFADTEA